MKKAITAIMITLFLASMLSMAFNITSVAAPPPPSPPGKPEWTAKVPDDYPTIQEAIYAYDVSDAPEGSITVNIDCDEQIIIDSLSDLTLKAGPDGATLTYSSPGSVIIIRYADNIVIKGFTIEDTSPYYYENGISLYGSSNCVVKGNTITGTYDGTTWYKFDYGINLGGYSNPSYNNVIKGNTISYCLTGIRLGYSPNNIVEDIIFLGNWHDTWIYPPGEPFPVPYP